MDNTNRGFLVRITTTGNYLLKKGSTNPIWFPSVENAEMYIEIYQLRRTIMEIVPDNRRMPDISELD